MRIRGQRKAGALRSLGSFTCSGTCGTSTNVNIPPRSQWGHLEGRSYRSLGKRKEWAGLGVAGEKTRQSSCFWLEHRGRSRSGGRTVAGPGSWPCWGPKGKDSRPPTCASRQSLPGGQPGVRGRPWRRRVAGGTAMEGQASCPPDCSSGPGSGSDTVDSCSSAVFRSKLVLSKIHHPHSISKKRDTGSPGIDHTPTGSR